MVQKNEAQKERLEKMHKMIKMMFGKVPANMEFIGNIEADYLENFLKMVRGVQKHPNIETSLFGFLRLHVAFKEEYAFCKAFNTAYLLSKGYTQKVLDEVVANIASVLFDTKHQALAKHAVKAIYESREVVQDDFDTLYEMGWSQKDVFDAIEHTGTLFKNGRILTCYMKKD